MPQRSKVKNVPLKRSKQEVIYRGVWGADLLLITRSKNELKLEPLLYGGFIPD